MITDAKLDSLLRQIQKAPDEQLTSRSVCYEGLLPGEKAEESWNDLSPDDWPVLRAAIRMGLVSETFKRWEADWPEEKVPDGGDYVVSLTGVGTERLIRLNEPKLRRFTRWARAQVTTVLVAAITALTVSWAGHFFGAPEPEVAPQDDTTAGLPSPPD